MSFYSEQHANTVVAKIYNVMQYHVIFKGLVPMSPVTQIHFLFWMFITCSEYIN